MSDHIDGPRQIGDPSADLTDLFAFTSPENPARTVLAANVFPTCGADAIFSNAIDHSIVVRRAKFAGLGDATKFETSDPEIRFTCRFDTLERGRRTKSRSSAVPVRCPMDRRFNSSPMTRKAHRRRTAPFAFLRACAPIHLSSPGYSEEA